MRRSDPKVIAQHPDPLRARATPSIDSAMRRLPSSKPLVADRCAWLKRGPAVFSPAALLQNTAGQVSGFLSQADEQPGAAAVGQHGAHF